MYFSYTLTEGLPASNVSTNWHDFRMTGDQINYAFYKIQCFLKDGGWTAVSWKKTFYKLTEF